MTENDSTPIIPLKQCSSKDQCVHVNGAFQPATYEFFRVASRSKKLQAKCRSCERAQTKKWRLANPDKVRQKNLEWRQNNPERAKALQQKRYEDNPNKERARSRQYNADHREERRAYDKVYGERNREKRRAASAGYDREHPERARIRNQRRRAVQKNLPYSFTPEDERRMFEYWDYRCAVCGEPASFWTYLAIDHWIALADKRADNPGTVPTNMIPLCHAKKGAPAGKAGCNNSKHQTDPTAWLVRHYGKRKAAQIIKRVQAYFQWVKDNQS